MTVHVDKIVDIAARVWQCRHWRGNDPHPWQSDRFPARGLSPWKRGSGDGVSDGTGLSDDQFEQMLWQDDYHASTPEGKLCFWDPTGSEGMTLEDAQITDANAERVTIDVQPVETNP